MITLICLPNCFAFLFRILTKIKFSYGCPKKCSSGVVRPLNTIAMCKLYRTCKNSFPDQALPWHETPCPEYPVWQVQLNDPFELVQLAFRWQLSTSVAHSSISDMQQNQNSSLKKWQHTMQWVNSSIQLWLAVHEDFENSSKSMTFREKFLLWSNQCFGERKKVALYAHHRIV